MRAWLGLAAKVAVSLAALGFALGQTDRLAVLAALSRVDAAMLAVAVLSFLLIPLFGALRWWSALRGMGGTATAGSLWPVFSAAMVFGQALPSVASDALRVLFAARRGHAVADAITSVVLERAAMLLALLGIVAATWPLAVARGLAGPPPWLVLALFAAGLLALFVTAWLEPLAAPLLRHRLLRPVAQAALALRRLLRSRFAVLLALLSLLSVANFVAAAALLGRAMNLPISLGDYLAFMPLVTVAATLPISLGGWGVREGTMVLLLAHVGVAAADAVALGLLFGALGAVSGVPGMVVWWLAGARR